MTDALAPSIVQTSSGEIRGERCDGIHRFFSVPYAAPPVGPLRFRAPEPPEAWAGMRDATRRGPTAPQHASPAGQIPGLDLACLIGEGWVEGDDFLTANIWTPDPAAAGLPVMVFVHGGAFLLGSKDAALYDGAAFARSGVVLVSINYRMGLEGFAPVPGGAANLGLRDQIAALTWVRRNARAFGGDPDNVTAFGESAGAASIADLLASPLAKGLFRRAIVQSGHGDLVRPMATALKLTDRLARRLKTTPDREGLEARSVKEGVAAVAALSTPTARLDLRDAEGRDPSYGLSRFLPVTGDEVLPEAPLKALAAGAGAEVELLIGTNREEMNLYFVPTGVREKLNGPLAWFLLSRSQPRALRILRAYGLGRKGRKAGHVFTDALHDLVFRWPARRFAAAHQGRTHVYEFGWRSPACDGALGACHGVELPFVFNTLAEASGPKGLVGEHPPQGLADAVHGIWVGFARDGALTWPEYSAADPQVYALETGVAAPEAPMPAASFLD